VLVDCGIPRNLVYSRIAGKAAGKKPTGHGFALPNEYGEAPMNLVFGGGDSSIEKMVASTERGLLVTRLWYIREVDPYEKVMTGMTRDGSFLLKMVRLQARSAISASTSPSSKCSRTSNYSAPLSAPTGEEAFEMVVPAMKSATSTSPK